MLRASRCSLLLQLHYCFNILCKLRTLHLRSFVKYRLCLNFCEPFRRIAGGLHLPGGQTLVKFWLSSTSFCWLVVLGFFGYPPATSRWIRKSGEFPPFLRFTPEEYSTVIQVGPRQQSGAMNSNWLYFAPTPTPWSSQGSKKSRRALGCCHLSSFHSFTLSCNMPCERWLTVSSSVTLWKKNPPNLHLFLFRQCFLFILNKEIGTNMRGL